jgi:hypothetical protein
MREDGRVVRPAEPDGKPVPAQVGALAAGKVEGRPQLPLGAARAGAEDPAALPDQAAVLQHL